MHRGSDLTSGATSDLARETTHAGGWPSTDRQNILLLGQTNIKLYMQVALFPPYPHPTPTDQSFFVSCSFREKLVWKILDPPLMMNYILIYNIDIVVSFHI